MGVGSEDFLFFSRNEPLHPLHDVLAEKHEEDELLSSKLRTQRECFPGSISIQFLLFIGMILDEASAGSFLLVLLLPLVGSQILLHSQM